MMSFDGRKSPGKRPVAISAVTSGKPKPVRNVVLAAEPAAEAPSFAAAVAATALPDVLVAQVLPVIPQIVEAPALEASAVDPAPESIEPEPAAVAAPEPAGLVLDATPELYEPAPPTAAQSDYQAEPAPQPEPKKDFTMNETVTNMQNQASDAIKTGTETAYANGKAALDQVTGKSKEVIEQGMKSIDEMTTMARGNVEAMLASTRAATSGLESIAHMVADFSRKSFEETTAAARAMTTVKTPNELMQLQNDFAKTQFDAAITEMSKMSETLVKLAGEVFEPMQNRVAMATDKIKSAAASTFQR